MTDPTLQVPTAPDNLEDYSDAVCFPLPGGLHTIIDAGMLSLVASINWKVLGKTVYYTEALEIAGRRRKYRMESLPRLVLFPGFGKQVDHINRNPLDNRRCNLRVATARQNALNKGPKPGSSSKYKGVFKVKGKEKWTASLTCWGRTHYLGTFDDETQAALAYNREVRKRCPEFGYINPITAMPGDPVPKLRQRRRRKRSRPQTT